MKSFRSAAQHLIVALGIAFASVAACAQATNSGDIRGIVTDTQGAVVPDTTVTVTNIDTGVTKIIRTDRAGLYDTSSIVVGTYSITFERQGFEKFERTKISLQVGTSTVNAVLKIGTVAQTVVVNTDIPLLTTETGAQQTTFEAKEMQNLPNLGGSGSAPDWQNFIILLPGSAGTYGGQQGTVNPTQLSAVNGNLPYNNILSDGASTTLGTSMNSDVNVFETVQEVQASTSAFSAQYGIGGIIFNQISKGGTSRFHGSGYDYFQSSQFNAYPYTFPGNSPQLASLRFNNFGGSIGGPIDIPHLGIAKKAFFYFDYDQIVNHTQETGTNSIPTAAVMGGDFSEQVGGYNQNALYDPTTQTIGYDANGTPYPIRKSFASEYGSNIVPSSLFDPVSVNFQKFYPTMSDHIPGGHFQTGTVTPQGILQSNFIAAVPVSYPQRKYFGRIDYDITPTNRITGSVTQGDIPAAYPSVVTAAPIGYTDQDIARLNVQITDVWTIKPNLVNEFRFGFTYQGNFFADLTNGQDYPQKLGWQFAKANEIPGVQFYTNYPYAWIEPSTSQYIYKENVFDPSDFVTLVKGRHVLHFGGEFGFYRNDNTPYAQINPGTLGFAGQYTSHWSLDGNGVAHQDPNTGADYADFLLGDASSWSAQNGSEYGARLKNPQLFIQDDYKLTPNLTVNLGLRYQMRFGINEVKGNVGAYDPTIINPANNMPGAYWYGATHTNGRDSLQSPKYDTVLPRVGFAYLIHPNMTIRGGFGIYAYNLSLDTYGAGALGIVDTSTGSYSDPTNGVVPGIKFSGPGTQYLTGAPLPYATPGTSPTRFNGQTAQYFQYNVPDPKIDQWNLAVEQMIGRNMSIEMAYVGSHGYNLNFPTDLNQVPTQYLGPNDAQYRPNPNYTAIDGSTNNAVSNYNALQASLKRRLSAGLTFDFNYTWSHFLDDQDSSGWGSRAGPINRQYEDAAQNYSNSNFDVRNAFKGRVAYDLPFGHGRMFMNENRWLDGILGGYLVTSTIQMTSGNPFSIFANGQNTYAVNGGGTPFVNYSGFGSGSPHKGINEWYNPAAFSMPADGTFGNVRRNSLYGPGIEYVNMSAGKEFQIHEGIKLQARVDATNVFNHPSFGEPNGGLNAGPGQQPGQPYSQAGSFGSTPQITSVAVGGRNLQGRLRFEF